MPFPVTTPTPLNSQGLVPAGGSITFPAIPIPSGQELHRIDPIPDGFQLVGYTQDGISTEVVQHWMGGTPEFPNAFAMLHLQGGPVDLTFQNIGAVDAVLQPMLQTMPAPQPVAKQAAPAATGSLALFGRALRRRKIGAGKPHGLRVHRGKPRQPV